MPGRLSRCRRPFHFRTSFCGIYLVKTHSNYSPLRRELREPEKCSSYFVTGLTSPRITRRVNYLLQYRAFWGMQKCEGLLSVSLLAKQPLNDNPTRAWSWYSVSPCSSPFAVRFSGSKTITVSFRRRTWVVNCMSVVCLIP